MYRNLFKLLSTAAVVSLLAAGTSCSESPDQTGPDAAGTDTTGELPSPVAAFDYRPQTIQVGQPVTFDGSASEPVDASLSFDLTWTFDHALESRGQTTDFIFTRPGEHKVELLADNAGWKDTAERTIEVEPAPAVERGPAALRVRVVNDTGAPVDTANVTVLGRDGTTSVDDAGFATLDALPTERRLTVVADAQGISPRFQTVVIPSGVERASIDVAVRMVTARQTLAVDESHFVDADDLRVRVPSLSFVDADGNRLRSDDVQIEVTRLGGDRDIRSTIPGSFEAWIDADARQHRYFGGLDIRAFHDGRPARLAPGRTLEVVIPATYSPTYEGLPVSILHLEPASGYWLRTGEAITEITPHSPTSIGTSVEIPRLGAWALAAPSPSSCDVEVRCEDQDGTAMDACTIRAQSAGLDGVGRDCVPTALTEGARCESAQHCVNCEEGATGTSGYIPSAPCYISPNGNSICPNSGGSTRVRRRYCPPDESFVCQPDASGLGHCIEQELPDCGISGLFCDVHRSVFVTPTPEQGVCSAPQTEFMGSEGRYSAIHIISGSATIQAPRGRLQLDALGPDAERRGSSGIVGSNTRCPTGTQTIVLRR